MASATNIRWQDQNVVKKDGKWTVDGRPTVGRKLVAQYSPPNIPEHYYIGLEVTAPVNSATPPHTHGGAALTATMVRGKMLNQTVCPHHDPESQGDGPAVYGPGDTWYEPPGCHHVRSENVGDEEAVFLAWFVISKEKVDAEGLGCLVLLDADVEERIRQRSIVSQLVKDFKMFRGCNVSTGDWWHRSRRFGTGGRFCCVWLCPTGDS